MTRFINTGQNNHWTAPMSDMQRERAEAPFEQRAAHGSGFVSAAIGTIAIALFVWLMLWVVGPLWESGHAG